jgi:hypothetical protein
MTRTFTSSKPCSWVNPRPVQDASMRLRTHGPIVPLEKPSLIERVLGWGR